MIRSDFIFQKITVKWYNEFKGVNMPALVCDICSGNADEVVVHTDGFSTALVARVCSEECFNMWLLGHAKV